MNAPYRLWSLHDMLKFHAHAFVKALALVARCRALRKQLDTLATLTDGRSMSGGPGAEADAELGNVLRAILSTELAPTLDTIGLTQSAKKARRIAATQGIVPAKELEDLQERIDDELEDGNFLQLTEEESNLFQPKEPLFGRDFEAKFPGAIYDLDEAAKCLALGRSTAAVFHLMRIVEAGLRAVYLCMGITAVLKGRNRNWARVFEKIDAAIEDKSKAAGGGWAQRNTFQQIRAQIAAVGDAWRNPTMHVGTKRTPEEADDILRVIKPLMTKISSLMDENGQPQV